MNNTLAGIAKNYGSRILPALILLLVLSVAARPHPAQAQGIVIAVDGVSFANIILPSDPDLPEHYLQEALREIIRDYGIEGIAPGDLISLAWYPQDPLTVGNAAVLELAGILARESRRAQREGKKLILAAHSWGAFLANAALGYATNDPLEEGREFERMGPLDLLITLGSPLGHRQKAFNPTEIFLAAYVGYVKSLVQEEFGPMQPPKGVERIVNFWAWGDIISGPLAGTDWLAGLEVEDHPADLEFEGYDQDPLRRTSVNTVVWHYYDSLMSGGRAANTKLRQAVAQLLAATLDKAD